ncbi:MAG TPA: hypothetical protein VGF30_11125, partial [Bacteroidia bacterium]
MKKLYFLSALLGISAGLSAQSPEFTKALESGNQKYKVKSYKLAITDYDAAIKVIAPDVDKMLAAKTQIPADKKFMLEP